MREISEKLSAVFWWFVAVVLLWQPGSALACAVCGAAQQEASRKAFVGTTAFMTFLPLLMLAVLVGWFIRRTLELEREEQVAPVPDRRRPSPPSH